jgi:hypothetical protein
VRSGLSRRYCRRDRENSNYKGCVKATKRVLLDKGRLLGSNIVG